MENAIQIDWHNDVQTFLIEPAMDAPETFGAIEVSVMVGRTVPDGEKVKKAAWRVKALCDGAEFDPAPNFVKAVNAVIMAKFGGTKYHKDSVAKAKEAFSFPEIQGEESESADNSDWTKFENAAELATERDEAAKAATIFFRGESDMRSGLKNLGLHIANVAESLEKPKAFAAWLASAEGEDGKALQKALQNKNAKSELIFVGRLPQDWFDLQPETSNSAKAYQRNFNNDKTAIAEEIAVEAWGRKKNSPKSGELQKAVFKVLSDIVESDRTGAEAKKALANAFLAHLNAASENGEIAIFAEGENGIECAKDGNGNYITATQFGSGNRAHELALSVIKECAALTPEAKAEKEEREADNEAANAVKPRTFAEYGVTEAAMHLARILSSRDDWLEVLDALQDMADRAEKDTWAQVLSDVKEGVDAEKAEAAKADAEADADAEA